MEAQIDADGALAQETADGITEKIVAAEVEATRGIFDWLTAKTAQIAEAVISTLRVDFLSVKTLTVRGEAVGQVVLAAGETELSVKYPNLTANSKVFFTPDRPIAVGVEKTPGVGFKLLLAAPSDLPLTIDYWIID